MFDEVSTIAHVGEKGVKSESPFIYLFSVLKNGGLHGQVRSVIMMV